MRFKVLIGPHVENGRTYQTGEVVETDRNLAEQFGGYSIWVEGRFDQGREVVVKQPRFAMTDEPATPASWFHKLKGLF